MSDKKDVDDYEKAAQAIWECEYLLIVAGPCFYEDSSKTVFNDKDGRCDPMLIQTDPEKFFGFWGHFYNKYNKNPPPDIYQILRKWRESYFDCFGQDLRKRPAPSGRQNKDEDAETAALPLKRCYVLTSTIDGSFIKSGFRDDEVFSLCGDINQWQCWIPCDKQLVWTIPDSRFRFDVDPKLQIAKPVKYIPDVRPDPIEEKFVVYDSDEEPPIDSSFPPIAVREVKAGDKPLSEHEKAKLTRLKNERMMRRLNRATVIPVSPDHQEGHPNLPTYQDWFTPTPTSNRMKCETHTFVVEKDLTEDGTADADTETVEGLEQYIGDGPEQPYILRPRINHSLAHILALFYNKYPFHEGTLEEVDPKEERDHRLQRWNEQQKFFESSLPEVSRNRRKHIAYNISIVIHDTSKSSTPPPPLQAPTPVRTAEQIIDEAFDGEDVGLTAASLPFLQRASLPPSRLSMSGRASISPLAPQISLMGSPAELTAKQILLGEGLKLTNQSTTSYLAGPGGGGFGGSITTRSTKKVSHDQTNIAEDTNAGLATSRPASSKLGNETARTHTPSVSFEPPSFVGAEMQEYTPWEQGKDGKFFFSYVPIVKTHQDPDSVMYDTIRIPFPFDAESEDLPMKGRISVVIECCILPEVVKPTAEEAGDKKKKKKEEKPAPGLKLDPVLEPTQYASFQLVGKISCVRKGKSVGASSVLSGLVSSSAEGSGGGGGGGTGGGGGRHGKNEEFEDKEEFEYRLHTRKGHVFRIGSTQTCRRSIRYIEIECPVMDPTKADSLHFGVSRKPANGDSPIAKATAGIGLFGNRSAQKDSETVILKKPSKKKKPRPVPNHQSCLKCHDLARPNVIMDPKKDIRAADLPGKKPYLAWEQAMMKALKSGGDGLVILEMGCEKKVDPARKNSERLYKMAKNTQKATHVRVSTQDLNAKGKKGFGSEGEKVITIIDTPLNFVNRLEKAFQGMKRRK